MRGPVWIASFYCESACSFYKSSCMVVFSRENLSNQNMKKSISLLARTGLGCAIAATLLTGCKCCSSSTAKLTPAEAVQIAEDAYIYGYSLITTEVTRMQMSNVSKPDDTHAPLGQFINVKRYPPGNYRGVSAPNADTLYSLAWLDAGGEPIVFSYPDMGKRYF